MSLRESGQVPDPKVVQEQLNALKGSDQNFEGWTASKEKPTGGYTPFVQKESGPHTFVKQSA